MSKKKAFSGSTMTLRDFHGGSIPSDLPLPSAPGMVVERKNHDRPGSGGWMGASIHRGYGGERVVFARQGSGTFARSYEEKVSYLPNPANIGRNYDEDERKPVDGHNYRGQSADFCEEQMYERQAGQDRIPERYASDNKGSYTSSKYSDSRADRHALEESSPIPTGSSLRTESFQRRPSMYPQDLPVQLSAAQDHIGHYPPQSMISGPPHSPYQTQDPGQPWKQNSLNQQAVTLGSVMGSGSGVQNVWTARREMEYSRTYPPDFGINDVPLDARGQTAGTRIAQASALEKISSGRWNPQIQAPIDSPQMYTTEYSQPYGAFYEGCSTYSSYDNVRSSADVERALYAESFKNDPTRGAYTEAGRGIDIRDFRHDVDKASPGDSRREQFPDGRGLGQLEPTRHADDSRFAFSEAGWRGSTGHKEPARFGGTKDGAYTESVYIRGAKDTVQYSVNEAASYVNETDAYVEARSVTQSSPGWVQSDPSPRRDYGDGMARDANKGPSSDFRGGFTSRDGTVSTEYGSAHRSCSHEGPYLDGSYHSGGKENSGHSTSPYFTSRDGFSHEVSDSARPGRSNDRSRVPMGSESDQGHLGRLHSPGGVLTSTYESGGISNTLPVESEVKGTELKGTPMERPKLKLFPRTKPLEVDQIEEPAQEGLQESLEINHSTGPSHSDSGTGSGTVVAASTVTEEPVQATERPKLSLKPRSQPVDVVPADSGSVKERMSVFGGARPRELVLKERGIDEFVIAGNDPTPTTTSAPSIGGSRTPMEGNRTSNCVDKQEKPEERSRRADQHDAVNARHVGRQESGRLERLESRGRREQMERDERKGLEYRHLQEKRESDRPDVDKQDSWRRPVELYSGPQTPMTAGEHSSGGSGRVIQSAADLAQAFSRSTSFGAAFGASASQGYASQRSPMPRSPGPGFGMGMDSPGLHKSTASDVPFSRLTEALSPGPRDHHASGVQSGYRRTSAF